MRGVRALDVGIVQISLELLRSDLLIESVLEIYLRDGFASRVSVASEFYAPFFVKVMIFRTAPNLLNI